MTWPEKKSERGGTYRTVIHQSNLHHGLKDSVLDFLWNVAVLYLGVEVLVQRSSLISTQSSMKVWLVSFLGGSEKRELGDWGSAISYWSRA